MAFLSENIVILQLPLWDRSSRKLPLYSETIPKFPDSLECLFYFQTSTNQQQQIRVGGPALDRCNNFLTSLACREAYRCQHPQSCISQRVFCTRTRGCGTSPLHLFQCLREWVVCMAWLSLFPCKMNFCTGEGASVCSRDAAWLKVPWMWSTNWETLSQAGLIVIPW